MSFQSAQTSMSILTGYNAFDREFRKELGFTAPGFSDLSILKFLKRQSRIMPEEEVGRHTFYYYEQADHLKASATISSVSNTTVDGTPSVIITLSAADHYNSGANSWPMVGNDVLFSNQISGLVHATNKGTPNAHTVTVKSLTNSTDVQTAAVVGSVINFAGMSVSEASSQVEMRNPRINKVTNQIKTTRKRYGVTDHAAQNKMEFQIDGKPYIHYLGMANTVEEFEFDEEMALLTNNINTATVTNAAGASVNTTLGLIPNINTNGITADYYGDVDLPTVQDWMSTLVANYADGEYMVLNGLNFGFALQNWQAELGKYDAAYAFLGGGETGKKNSIEFDLQAVKMPSIGVTLYFKGSALLSHAGSLGNDRLAYKGMGIFIPMGNALSPKTNKSEPYLKIRYAKPQGAPSTIQGDIQVWETGANAQGNPTSDVLERNVHMVSYKALQAFNLKKFMIATAGF